MATAYENRTKEELLELAAERGIEGRTSMTKDELIAALRGEKSGEEPSEETSSEEPSDEHPLEETQASDPPFPPEEVPEGMSKDPFPGSVKDEQTGYYHLPE